MARTDEAIERIKEMILTGELGPGDRLPKEADFAERLGLSRNSLREAVKALSLIRVLDVRQGDGTYVTSLRPELLLDTLGFVLDFHRNDSVLGLLEVRRILEPAATAMAAYHMRDEEIAELHELLEAMENAKEVPDLIAIEVQFHHRIAAGSGNAVLATLVDSLSPPTIRARTYHQLTEPGAVERSHEQHRAIVQALESRQAEVARSWAATHVACVEDWLRHSR
ncbi:MAG TPA: GntR family transcriptional regulator [Micromonosporaceae bacterium]|nr:GntR family transcriptional regulator [Micromonosporaceae bacterium]HCU49749.1 GntR family transcriptional regulator [Micromonosporaceae bacterium]